MLYPMHERVVVANVKWNTEVVTCAARFVLVATRRGGRHQLGALVYQREQYTSTDCGAQVISLAFHFTVPTTVRWF